MAKSSAKETEYAIRCFKNGKRKFTARLTQKEALNFRKTAIHLAKFLTKNYQLDEREKINITAI